MSVFNKIFENLIEDGYQEITDMDTLFYYIKRLKSNEDIKYTISYSFNWIDKCDAWLIKIK